MRDTSGRFLLKGFWDAYDHPTLGAMTNVFSLLLSLTIVGIIPAMAGQCAVAASMARGGEEPTWRTYWRGTLRYFIDAFVVLWLGCCAIASVVLGFLILPTMGTAGYFLAGFNLWACLAALAMLAMYLPGRVLLDAPRGRALKLAAGLVLLRPLYCLFVLVWAVIWTVISALLFPISLPFFAFHVGACGWMSAWIAPMRELRALLLAPALPSETTIEAVAGKPTSWADVKARGQTAQAFAAERAGAPSNEVPSGWTPLFLEADETRRGWSDVFRPWQE